MPGRDIIVIGASAGGVEALSQLLSLLPRDIPAAIFVVLHIPSEGYSILPKILNRAIAKRQKQSSLKAIHPQDGEQIEYGRIYVAPPDLHLLVKRGSISLARGPKENGHRPAVDPLFRSAARAYGQRVVGVVLSGTLDDGTAGLMAVKQRVGVAIVQDPEEAMYLGMPRSAIENVEVDRILPVADMATLLVELARQPIVTETAAISDDMEMEADMAELELNAMQNPDRPGTPSPYGCPDCGGVLWELDEGRLMRFRCRTGHAYSTDSLLAAQSESLEDALWSALRALEEKAALTQRLGDRARDRQQTYSARRFEEQARAAHQQATLVRQLILKSDSNGSDASTANGQVVGSQKNAAAGGNPEAKMEHPALEDSSLPQKVVAICASAGGLNALSQVLSALPVNFPAAITVVQHISPHYPSMMADILSRRTKLPVKQARSGDYLRTGTVYIAPPDHHLLVNADSNLSLSHSELVHFVRPSADLLFESVAASFKQQAIAVVLTGTGSDGAMGARAIEEMGGTVIVQDYKTAEFGGMPEAAINTGVAALVLPLNEIALTLVKLVAVEVKG
ncbi:MAG: Protein-glutamate methylesterase/protein-glutamine glutaminase [Chroococcidiopsis sp. SAG 2025]|uniref:chemotaxis protein CheB n=1 Tax=Chroococcidiopsis sp. SAG 2025 TaxID=171389 RepID=UPI002936F120|nr:chemotaxis protein CheB [Chroococcidiopsis sp. SAG 2025]MDV2993962.1 Protein-glutamate methylesterase/protein-glutamine glutaminase [Chroococcidiopsis sp. SAG 2025]